MTALAPGMLVECVDDREAPMLKAGSIYTVDDIDPYPGPSLLGPWCEYGVYLVEVRATVGNGDFSPHRFRPLSGDRLSIFRQHLTNVPSKAKEDA